MDLFQSLPIRLRAPYAEKAQNQMELSVSAVALAMRTNILAVIARSVSLDTMPALLERFHACHVLGAPMLQRMLHLGALHAHPTSSLSRAPISVSTALRTLTAVLAFSSLGPWAYGSETNLRPTRWRRKQDRTSQLSCLNLFPELR